MLWSRVLEKKDAEGVYRKSGLQTLIDTIVATIDAGSNPEDLEAALSTAHVHDFACIVKQYIRTLSEPLIPIVFADDFKRALTVAPEGDAVKLLKLCIYALPTNHFEVFKAFTLHIAEVLTGDNSMTFDSMSIVLGQNFFRMAVPPTEILTETGKCQLIARKIFANSKYIFENGQLPPDLCVKALNTLEVDGVLIEAGAIFPVGNLGEGSFEVIVGDKTIVVGVDQFQLMPDGYAPPFRLWKVVPSGTEHVGRIKYLKPDES
jgi:hypothetical protein